jgi:hypothetical protein
LDVSSELDRLIDAVLIRVPVNVSVGVLDKIVEVAAAIISVEIVVRFAQRDLFGSAVGVEVVGMVVRRLR